jgi:hypothetical protein
MSLPHHQKKKGKVMLIRRRPQWSAACLCLPLALSSFVAVRTFAAGIALQHIAVPAGSPH